MWIYVAIGALFLLWFFLPITASERKHKDVLLSLHLFRSKVSNLGLGTQLIQWLVIQGSFFSASVFLQKVDGYNAVKTGLVLTPATIGILLTSAGAGRFAKRHSQRWLIIVGFGTTIVGMILQLVLVRPHSAVLWSGRFCGAGGSRPRR